MFSEGNVEKWYSNSSKLWIQEIVEFNISYTTDICGRCFGGDSNNVQYQSKTLTMTFNLKKKKNMGEILSIISRLLQELFS